jgi:sugar phosphate permease
LLSAVLALATWLRVRDRPEDLGYPAVHAAPAETARVPWLRALGRVLANPATWPPFFVNAGVGGSFLAFAGLWAVPFLVDTRGMSRVLAAQHASLLLLGVAIGSLVIGRLSDRLGSRRGLMRLAVLLYTLSWLPWLLQVQWPHWASLGWFALMGLLIPGFTLSWTLAKEANPPQYSGIATSVVTTGIFLGAGILQPLVGWVLDRARATGAAEVAWDRGLAWLAGAAAFGLVMSLLIRGPHGRAA